MGDAAMRATGWARSFPVAGGVRAGRQWTRRHLESLGWTGGACEVVDAVLLTVSELVTNAHIHGHSTAELVLVWDGRYLRVSVHDSSDRLPVPRTADGEASDGRGMALVEALADEWEVRAQARGKTVSARFRPPGGEGRPGEADPESTPGGVGRGESPDTG